MKEIVATITSKGSITVPMAIVENERAVSFDTHFDRLSGISRVEPTREGELA